MFKYTASYTDLYQLSMAQVYFETGKNRKRAVFDYFFRKLPFGGGYAVFCGLDPLLETIENLKFEERDIDFLQRHGFSDAFLEELKAFRFSGDIYSSPEGDLVFPIRPVLQVEASLMEAQILETHLLNVLNYQTLVATKASRIRQVSGKAKLVDFGLRRAQGPAGYFGARAAVVGGFSATSNVRAALDFNLEASGTMAHSFVQSYEREIDAFRDFARYRPDNCVLLADTYDTLKSGIPNAIIVAQEMEKRGERLAGIRIDSGDLAYLAKEARKMLDEAGLPYVKIAASNQLDEYVIKSLGEQEAPVDFFGVGTSLIVGQPDAALDGVYKLSQYDGKPAIKLSESIQKINFPEKKQVYRLTDDNGGWIGADVTAMRKENNIRKMTAPFDPLQSLNIEKYHKQPLMTRVMAGGKRIIPQKPLTEIAEFTQIQLQSLPAEYKRFDNPHIYKIGFSEALHSRRNQWIKKHKKTEL